MPCEICTLQIGETSGFLFFIFFFLQNSTVINWLCLFTVFSLKLYLYGCYSLLLCYILLYKVFTLLWDQMPQLKEELPPAKLTDWICGIVLFQFSPHFIMQLLCARHKTWNTWQGSIISVLNSLQYFNSFLLPQVLRCLNQLFLQPFEGPLTCLSF